jgi:hypothetical protein
MQYPPYCDSTQQVCPAWSKPKPEDCPEDPSYKTVDCNVRRDQNTRTPNFNQGYGRPELKNVIWSNYSTYSIWIHETFMPHGYQRSWTFTILKSRSEFPVKVTLVWTGKYDFVDCCSCAFVSLIVRYSYIPSCLFVVAGQMHQEHRRPQTFWSTTWI